MNTSKPCPKCGTILEKVHSAEGDLLGYFCKLLFDHGCDYIDVMSTAEHESLKVSNAQKT